MGREVPFRFLVFLSPELLARVPLLMAVDGATADLVRLSSGGVVAESENPEALVNAAD